MSLELFTRKGSRSSKPKISITTAGQIGINSSCLANFFKGKKYVLLYGDKKEKIIGIKPLDKDQDNCFSISFSAKKISGSISGRSFLNTMGIDFTKSRTLDPNWNEKENMLVIKL